MSAIVCYADMLPQDAAWAIREDQKAHNAAREARFWRECNTERHYAPSVCARCAPVGRKATFGHIDKCDNCGRTAMCASF